MTLDLQGSAISATAPVRRHVEQRTLFELARYGDNVQSVRMRVTERAASAARRYHCGLAVTVVYDGFPRYVLARAEGDDLFRLVEAVLARASSQVGGELERAHAAQQARAEWLDAVARERRGS